MTIEQIHAAGFPVDEEQFSRLYSFVERLLDENSRINLTAIRTVELAWPLHILDCLAIGPLISKLNARRVVDLGTGGGVPGIPLACVLPDVQFCLIDATRKKIDAVARIIEPLRLSNVKLMWGRAEALAKTPSLHAANDLVVARAVAKLPELAPLAASFLRAGGHCAFMKSTLALDGEISDAKPAAQKANLMLCEVLRYSLPSPHGDRAIVVYQRT